jgi:hypothetical protein
MDVQRRKQTLLTMTGPRPHPHLPGMALSILLAQQGCRFDSSLP